MQDIIAPIDRQIIESELTHDKFLRSSNNGDNLIYVVTAHNSPNIMREIGRLREATFRAAGGGTGKDCDIDKYDISDEPYKQLFVWDPRDKEIVGGYRFMHGKDAKRDENGIFQFGTSGLFTLSEKFITDYLPYTVELGRSFVQPNFQPTKDSRKGIFSLDNLWDGLGAIWIENPDMRYFFGKVTMYPHYNRRARNMILYFMHKYFPDTEKLVFPIKPLFTYSEEDQFEKVFIGNNYDEDYKILVTSVRELNTGIPPLVNAYMNLSRTMLYFGTSLNNTFGEVEETGILVNVNDIHQTKKERHVNTYIPKK
ncbi:MAG: GNAT family N-acetyltransferase [Bacteroidota bacterium]